MTAVALITQPLRSAHCAAFVTGTEGVTHILTANPAAFASLDIGNASLESVQAPPQVLPTSKLMASRLYRRILNWSREGSSFGLRVERLARSILWRLRYFDRALVLVRLRRERSKDPFEEVATTPLYEALSTIYVDSQFSEMVVFDLFDLPVALAFADEHSIEVKVR